LASRAHQKEVLKQRALVELQNRFKELSALHIHDKELSFFNTAYETFQKSIETIEDEDNADNERITARV